MTTALTFDDPSLHRRPGRVACDAAAALSLLAPLPALWTFAIIQIGYAAFILPVIATVPVCFVALVLITRG